MKLIEYIKGYGTKNKPTQRRCIVLILAGGYLVYTAYKLFMSRNEWPGGWQNILLWAGTILFLIFGGVVLAMNIKVYLKKQFFVPGVDDVDQNENGEGGEENKKITAEPEGEISYAAHWVNPDAGTDDEEE